MYFALAFILSYLAGSIPFAYLAGKLFKKVDLREVGSGNVGTNNVYREVGWTPALLVFIADCAKMGIPLLILRLLSVPTWVEVSCALLIIAGHNWPIWLNFQGGRGMLVILVASGIIVPLETLVILGILLYGILTSTLALMCGVSLLVWPLLAIAYHQPLAVVFFTVGVMVLGFARRLQGSPAIAGLAYPRMRREVITNRLLYDREVTPH